jgi:F-type H+-transporting ATPase subunit gamma
MANARILLKRRKSARNTRKITRTMELVASAKLRKAEEAAARARPYAEGLSRVLGRIAPNCPNHPLLIERPIKKVVILVAASDRGLCGSYNTNIVRRAIESAQVYEGKGASVEFIALGRKGASLLKFQGRTPASAHRGLIEKAHPERITALLKPLVERYTTGEIDRVEIAFAQKSGPLHKPAVMTLLPCTAPKIEGQRADHGAYLAEPEVETIVAAMVPMVVMANIRNAILDTAAGEHSARRIAMKNATDSADDLIRALTLHYNRLRQAKITQEIAEIVGAVEAMA